MNKLGRLKANIHFRCFIRQAFDQKFQCLHLWGRDHGCLNCLKDGLLFGQQKCWQWSADNEWICVDGKHYWEALFFYFLKRAFFVDIFILCHFPWSGNSNCARPCSKFTSVPINLLPAPLELPPGTPSAQNGCVIFWKKKLSHGDYWRRTLIFKPGLSCRIMHNESSRFFRVEDFALNWISGFLEILQASNLLLFYDLLLLHSLSPSHISHCHDFSPRKIDSWKPSPHCRCTVGNKILLGAEDNRESPQILEHHSLMTFCARGKFFYAVADLIDFVFQGIIIYAKTWSPCAVLARLTMSDELNLDTSGGVPDSCSAPTVWPKQRNIICDCVVRPYALWLFNLSSFFAV